MIIYLILILLGFVLLIKGADFLVDGSSSIAKKFKIPEIIIGLTIVALGTSMPELMVSVKASLTGHSDMALGNIIGSCMANTLLILGVCAFITNLKIPKNSRQIENPLCLIATAILFALCLNGGTAKFLSQREGVILLLIFFGYLIYLFLTTIKKYLENEKTKNKYSDELDTVENVKKEMDKTLKNKSNIYIDFMKILLGIFGLKYGADFVVDNAVNIAMSWGISEKVISSTVIAVGTSLPELVASVTAVIKKRNDLAIGNIIGSNLFNILLILGLTSAISPISYSLSYNVDIIILIIASALLILFPYVGKAEKSLNRVEGAIFLIIYISYIYGLAFLR